MSLTDWIVGNRLRLAWAMIFRQSLLIEVNSTKDLLWLQGRGRSWNWNRMHIVTAACAEHALSFEFMISNVENIIACITIIPLLHEWRLSRRCVLRFSGFTQKRPSTKSRIYINHWEHACSCCLCRLPETWWDWFISTTTYLRSTCFWWRMRG